MQLICSQKFSGNDVQQASKRTRERDVLGYPKRAIGRIVFQGMIPRPWEWYFARDIVGSRSAA